MCTNTPGGHSCSCAPGFSLGADGRTCSDTGVLGLCYAAWGPGQCSNPSQVIDIFTLISILCVFNICIISIISTGGGDQVQLLLLRRHLHPASAAGLGQPLLALPRPRYTEYLY